MSDLEHELEKTLDILYQNAIALNKLRIKRAVEEFDPTNPNPPVMRGIDEEYIRKHLKA